MKKQTKNKSKQSGFTLIELLAVITIMGILLLVAIPSVSKIINNVRRDTFKDTAQQYINSVSTLWISDSLYCQTENNNGYNTLPANVPEGSYYVLIDTNKNTHINGYVYPDLLEKGGKSSWANADVGGYVKIEVEGDPGSDKRTITYSILLADDGSHGTTGEVKEADLTRAAIHTEGASKPSIGSNYHLCKEI